MKPTITITEEKIDNQFIDKIKISGAIAEEWCDENNCILLSKEFENPIRELENNSTIFFAKVDTDDYE